MRGPIWFLLPVLLGACTGGGGGADSGGPPPPQQPFATTINTGLAVGGSFDKVAVVDRWIMLPVSERDMGQDRNGDGDTSDHVVASVDTETEAVLDLGFAVTGPVLATPATFAFLVSEAAQGGTDLNGDGDIADAVWFVFDPAQPIDVNNPVNTGATTRGSGLPGIATEGGYVFLQSELAQGMDLNNDGDLLDNVAAVYHEAVRSVVPVAAITHAPGTPMVARNGRVLVLSSETLAGTDFNRDGDSFDTVLTYVDFNTSSPIVRAVGGVFPRAVSSSAYQLTDTAAVYLINEGSEAGIDLNGDGDSADAIVAIFDIAGGTGEQLPTSPQIAALALAARTSIGIGASGSRAVVALDEGGQGNTDINGDLDRFDAVLGWIDTAGAPGSMQIEPLALAAQPLLVSGTRALVSVNEKSSGAIVGVDLNGDGDTNDNVAFMVDMPAPGTGSTNLGFATTTSSLFGNDALIGVPEAGHFGGDLNGNGIANDVVTIYFDFSDTPPTARSLGIVANAASIFRASDIEVRLAALIPEGQSGNFNDLNGDGDNTDRGVILVGLDPSGAPPPLLPPTPFFAGTGAFFVTPPLRVRNNVFAFPSAEDMVRADLNGDADTLDTVLHFVRYEVGGP